jgi:putative transcriptional regulator
MDSLTGCFLVASPYLPDPNFFRTVVLILRHDESGAFGVVLTRPLENTVGEIWSTIAETEVQNDHPIYLGGPVSGPLLALHGEVEQSEGEVIPHVYFATLKHHLEQIVTHSERPFRLFTGYSGWGEGQLESEFEEGSWLSTPATAPEIFGESDELWKSVAGRIGWEILSPGSKLRHIPPEPDMN